MTMSSLEGRWQPVYAELDGEEAPRMLLEQMEIEFTRAEYAVRFGGQTADQGSYTLDAEGHLTLAGMIGPNAGKSIPGIYKFAGDTLSICYGLGGARPRKFATQGEEQLYLVNYQRKHA